MTENHLVRWDARPEDDRWQGILSVCAIVGSWLYLNRSVLNWLSCPTFSLHKSVSATLSHQGKGYTSR